MNRAAAIVVTLVPAMLIGAIAAADSGHERRCEQRGAVLAYLSRQYAEQPVAMGLAENGGVVEVLTSRDGKTFTIIVTTPDGKTCMVAAGEAWQPLARHHSPRT